MNSVLFIASVVLLVLIFVTLLIVLWSIRNLSSKLDNVQQALSYLLNAKNQMPRKPTYGPPSEAFDFDSQPYSGREDHDSY